MKTISLLLMGSLFAVVVGCAKPEFTGTPSPFQGLYVGTETLEGGSTVPAGDYPLRARINARGQISITDVDDIAAYGELQGDSFYVVRGSPRQVFDGKVVGKTISGVTTENPYTGDGTFQLERQEQ